MTVYHGGWHSWFEQSLFVFPLLRLGHVRLRYARYAGGLHTLPCVAAAWETWREWMAHGEGMEGRD